ncbi:MAG: UbiA family prenyltransferase [Thermodesulfobacteriota bacterium]|nr:UbiA family prenyltransferase [Thermodesulfobacteriota bacterium]
MKQVLLKFRIYEALQGTVPVFFGFFSNAFDWRSGAFLAMAFLQQLYIYVFNDYCDYEDDLRNPRKKKLWKSANEAKCWAGIFFSLSVALSLIFSLNVLIVFSLIHLICTLYSHPITRIKAKACVAEFIHFFAGGLFYLMGVVYSFQVISGENVRLFFFFALLYVSGGMITEWMDCESDQARGVETFCVKYGESVAFVSVFILQASGIILAGVSSLGKWTFAFLLGYISKIFFVDKNVQILRYSNRIFFALFTTCLFLMVKVL